MRRTREGRKKRGCSAEGINEMIAMRQQIFHQSFLLVCCI